MKKLLASLVMFLAVASFAVEMDTLFVVNAEGETIGLVYEKGSVPVIPDDLGIVGVVAKDGSMTPIKETAPVIAPKAVRRVETANRENVRLNRTYVDVADSAQYYQDLADRYRTSGASKARNGRFMMVVGGVAAILGFSILMDDDDISANMAGAAALSLVGGSAVFTVGTVFSCIGSSRIRKASRLEDKARHFRASMASLKVVPTANPVDGSVGGTIAFNF